MRTRILTRSPEEVAADVARLRRAMADAEGAGSECSYCTTRITLLGGSWTADDGTIACLDNPDTSAAYAPHKSKEAGR